MKLSPLVRRLTPIFVSRFFMSLVFWYGIEKLFMTTIGYNPASIGMMAAVYSVISILMEVPSGILADRWSRKGVIILANIALALSALTGWLAHDITSFLLSAICWGMYDALASGVDTSQLYDTLLEEQGHANNFQKILGRYEVTGGIALVIGATLGGFIGNSFSLRDAFLASIVPAIIAIIATSFIKETKIQHQEERDAHVLKHAIGTFRAVFRNKNLTWILVSMLALSQVNNLIGEMHQLWYLSLNVPITLYGFASGIVISTYGIGGAVTEYLSSKKRVTLTILVIIFASIVASITSNFAAIVATQFVLGFFTYTLGLVFISQINHQLPSKYRAGASSAVHSASRVIFIPLVLGFGWVSTTVSVFTASWILVILACVALYSELHSRFKRDSV